MEHSFEGSSPTVHPDASIAAGATLVGDVTVEAGASVWPGAVIRGDMAPVRIGEGSHVEDNGVVHMAEVGPDVLVGHGVVIDARAAVGAGSLVSNGAILNGGVSIGEGSIVAAGAVVPDGREVPPGSFVRGVPAEVVPLEETSLDAERILDQYAASGYTDLVARHDDLFAGPEA